MSASYGTLILDEADSGGNLIVRGSVTIALSQRVPDAGDDLIFGQAPVTGAFRAGGPPSVRLPFNDTFGPQGDDAPGTTYTITYNGVPGSPAPWSFYFISTNGAVQRLSALASTPAAQPGQMYLPLSSPAPAANQVPVFSGTGYATVPTTLTAAGVGADASGAAATAQANAETYAAGVAQNLDPVNAGFAYLAYNGAAVNAIGDGASHPLSGVFSTQGAAQTFFSAAYAATGIAPALTDELNWWVIQTYLADGNRVYIPAGAFLLHRALILPNGLATGLAVLGAPGLSMLKLRSHTVSGGLADCSVIIDKWLLSQATSIALGTGYNYNNPDPALGENLTIAGLVIDGNSANVGSGFYPGYNYGIGLDAYSDITIRDVRVQNVNGWGYREAGTTAAYTERGSYVNLTALSNAFWGCYIGYRNRKKAMANCIAMNNGKWTGANGAVGTAGSVKGSVQNTACGGFFLDCSEMETNGLQAHGNNGDGIYIRNVLACQYNGLRATYNGGAGIHVLGLVSSHGANWLAVCNGTNPGLGSLNVASPAPDSGGTGGGGTGTYTGAPDVWFEDSANTYGITNFSQVTNIECGTNTSVSTTWGDAGAEVYGLWVDDGLGATDLVIRSLHNTSSLRVPAAWSSESLVIGDPQPYYATVTANGNWTCPATGYYRARATSAGGGGGGGSGGSSTQAGGGGGAAGMPSEGTQFVEAGASVSVTIGSGGTAGTGTSSGTAGAGGQGGNTVIGSPFSITSPGSAGGAGAPAGTSPGAGGIPGIAQTGTQRFPGFGGAANSSSGAPFPGGTVGGGQGAAASGSNGGNGGAAGILGGGVTAAGSGTTASSAGGTGTSAAANSGCGAGGGGGGNTGGTGGNGGVGGSGLAEFWRVG